MFIPLNNDQWVNADQAFKVTTTPSLPSAVGYNPDGSVKFKGTGTEEAHPIISALVLDDPRWVRTKNGEFINISKLDHFKLGPIFDTDGRETGLRRLSCFIGKECVIELRQDEAINSVLYAVERLNTRNHTDRIG